MGMFPIGYWKLAVGHWKLWTAQYVLIVAAVGLVCANALAVFQAMCDGNFR